MQTIDNTVNKKWLNRELKDLKSCIRFNMEGDFKAFQENDFKIKLSRILAYSLADLSTKELRDGCIVLRIELPRVAANRALRLWDMSNESEKYLESEEVNRFRNFIRSYDVKNLTRSIV